MTNINTSIIEGIKNGNAESLHTLYNTYNGMLVAFARHTVRNPFLAEDFVQDAFCTLWENRQSLNSDLSIQAFLFKLVFRRCVDYLRKQRAQENFRIYAESKLKELEIMQHTYDNMILSEISAKEIQKIIQETLQQLPDQTREIFQLSRDHFLKNTEIAEKFGVTVKAIEYHISKALHQFRNSLKDYL